MIEAAQFTGCLGDHGFDRLLIGDIGLYENCLAPEFFDFALHFFGLIAMRSEIDGDIGPLRCQLDRQRSADPQRRSRNQRVSPREFHLYDSCIR